MLLKRVYDQDKLKRDAAGAVVAVEPGAVKGVEIKRADHGVQRFTRNYIDGALAEGWLSMGGGRLTIMPVSGDPLVYEILRTPAIYCCHCDDKIGAVGDGATPEGAKRLAAHVAEKHAGAASNDPTNPAGYRQENFFTCVNLGSGVNAMTKAEAVAMDKKVRAAVLDRLGENYRRVS
jgi:hypothetical protein